MTYAARCRGKIAEEFRESDTSRTAIGLILCTGVLVRFKTAIRREKIDAIGKKKFDAALKAWNRDCE